MVTTPVYTRIRADLAEQLASGKYKPGERLPSETALADQYGVTRMTVRQAVDGLVDDGLVVRRQGAGTFVSETGWSGRPLNRLSSFSEDLGRAGLEVDSVVLSQAAVDAPDDVRQALGLEPASQTVELERLRSVNDRPVSIAIVWLPLRLVPALVREPMAGRSLYAVLESKYGIRPVRAQQRITAVGADDRLARMLDVEQGSPLVAVQRLTYAEDNQPLELARSWTVPDMPLWIDLKR